MLEQKQKEVLIKDVNQNFRIKVVGVNFVGSFMNKAVGFSGLEELLGEELAVKLCQRALDSTDEIHKANLRRGLTIKFMGR